MERAIDAINSGNPMVDGIAPQFLFIYNGLRKLIQKR
jgi:hypothetical protein